MSQSTSEEWWCDWKLRIEDGACLADCTAEEFQAAEQMMESLVCLRVNDTCASKASMSLVVEDSIGPGFVSGFRASDGEHRSVLAGVLASTLSVAPDDV